MKKSLGLAALFLLLLLLPGCSRTEESFPGKTVQIIVPYAAGGGADQTARALAASSKAALGQAIAVVNKAGEAGAVDGLQAGAAAKADGYTVTMITADLVTLPQLGQNKLDYRKFEPILRVNVDPAALTVRADSPWKNVNDFIAYAKTHPEQLRIGNAGAGSVWHVAALALEQKGAVRFAHVSFPGAAPAVAALAGREIEAVTVSYAETANLVAAGKLRVLGVMSERPPAYPAGVPTMKQQGYDLALGTWRGLAVPKGTPAPVVKALHDAFQQGSEDPSFVQYMAKAGMEQRYLSGADFALEIKVQEAFFHDFINGLGLHGK